MHSLKQISLLVVIKLDINFYVIGFSVAYPGMNLLDPGYIQIF